MQKLDLQLLKQRNSSRTYVSLTLLFEMKDFVNGMNAGTERANSTNRD